MANVTITVDDEVLKRARIRAIERGESVNSYLAGVLRVYAGDAPDGESAQQRAIRRFLEIGEAAQCSSDAEWKFRRDEIYDRPYFAHHHVNPNTGERYFRD